MVNEPERAELAAATTASSSASSAPPAGSSKPSGASAAAGAVDGGARGTGPRPSAATPAARRVSIVESSTGAGGAPPPTNMRQRRNTLVPQSSIEDENLELDDEAAGAAQEPKSEQLEAPKINVSDCIMVPYHTLHMTTSTCNSLLVLESRFTHSSAVIRANTCSNLNNL